MTRSKSRPPMSFIQCAHGKPEAMQAAKMGRGGIAEPESDKMSLASRAGLKQLVSVVRRMDLRASTISGAWARIRGRVKKATACVMQAGTAEVVEGVL